MDLHDESRRLSSYYACWNSSVSCAMSDDEAELSGTDHIADDSELDLEEIARELDDQEGQGSADIDEDGPGTSTVNGTIVAIPAGTISNAAVTVLEERWSAWKAVTGNKRKTVWRSLANELRALPEHKGLTREQWNERLEVC
jgi:hypothetical protein